MNEAPKKIYHHKKKHIFGWETEEIIEYIRADIVDELVEALIDATDAMMAFAELNNETAKALAVLKKVRGEE